jgi:hypothetical protein
MSSNEQIVISPFQRVQMGDKQSQLMIKVYLSEHEQNRGQRLKSWMRTLIVGCASAFTCCCCCCGFFGKMRGPQTIVKYDDPIYFEMSPSQREKLHMYEWATSGKIACKAFPLMCCCCCGICGEIGPIQGGMSLGEITVAPKNP